jgi:tRNA A37 methylthiotransferase MiaB
VSERDAHLRVKRLSELASQGKKEYICCWIGKETEFVFEKQNAEKSCRSGVTANYLKVWLSCREFLPQEGILMCRIIREKSDRQDKRFDAEAEIIDNRFTILRASALCKF